MGWVSDAVQLTVIVKHLKHYYPDWKICVEVGRGKHSCFYGLCDDVFIIDDHSSKPNFDKVYNLIWPECSNSYHNLPCTKVTKCLKEIFNIEPILSLFIYEINVRDTARKTVSHYLSTIPKRNGYVVIHYQGNSSVNAKNLKHEDIKILCEYLVANQYTPIILDWDERSPIPDQRSVFCPGIHSNLWKGNMGDAETIAALIHQAILFIGIDSGPLHVAGATSTPSIGVWTRHHPINFFEPCPNVLHILPKDSRKNIRGIEKLRPRTYFENSYKHLYYDDLKSGLLAAIKSILCIDSPPQELVYKSPQNKKYGEKYYLESKLVGLDYSIYGDWQKKYTKWLTNAMNLKEKTVLDVGCACGAITKGFKDHNVSSCGIDINEYCINLGREKWPEVPLYTCDACNLHILDNDIFDFVHIMQVIEYFKPEMASFILSELNRVSKIEAILFCVLEAKNTQWWGNRLEIAGWKDCKTEYHNKLTDDPDSYLPIYNWNWLCYKKIRG